MKLGRKLLLLLFVTLILLFAADYALKTMQHGGDLRRALRSVMDPIRQPLIKLLRAALEFLED